MKITDFVLESNRIEGIIGTSEDDRLAHQEFLLLDTITVKDLVRFVSLVQPGAVLRDRVGLNVQVGNHIPLFGGPRLLRELKLLLTRTDLTSWERHQAYENLHPFTDGNGRSGRALWLWDMGGEARLGFLHTFYYQTLASWDGRS